jgi:hypothetical protein
MKLALTSLAVILGIGIFTAASSAASQPKWIASPTCRATTTSITCAGKATGLAVHDPDWPPTPAIFGRVVYTCAEDPSVRGLNGTEGPLFEGGSVQNGRQFSVRYTPGPTPDVLEDPNGPGCPSGNWNRDPSYYNVSVGIAQSDPNNFVLFSPLLGTVSP